MKVERKKKKQTKSCECECYTQHKVQLDTIIKFKLFSFLFSEFFFHSLTFLFHYIREQTVDELIYK